MGLFDRFRRKNVNLNQVDDYYTQSRRQNPLVAILLGILSFIVTLVLLWLLFMGGRWVYRKITNNDNKNAKTSQQQTDQQKKEGNGSSNNQGNSQDQAQSSGNTSSTSTNQPSGSGSSQSSSGGDAAGSSTQQNTPALGDNPMPRTGDEGM